MFKKSIRYDKYVIFLFVIAICLGIKALWGVGWYDEGYYLATTHRIFMGDIPLYEEWYPSHLLGVVLLPVYALYNLVTGSTEGIVLFFRLFQLAVLFGGSLVVYKTIELNATKKTEAFVAACILLIYSTENKALYSYSDLSTLYMALVCMCLLNYEWKKCNVKLIGMIAGIAFVCTIFANAYNIVIYLYFVVILLFKFKRQNDKKYLELLIFFTLGCCIIGFTFLGYVVFNSSISELSKTLHYFLNFPGHVARNVLVALAKWCWYVIKPYGLVIIAAQVILFIYAFIKEYRQKWDKNQKYNLYLIESLFAVAYIVIQYFFTDDKSVIGISYIPITALGLLCFIMLKQKKWDFMIYLYIPGILLSMSFQCASDTGIFAIITGFVLSAIASVVFICRFLDENPGKVLSSVAYVIFGIVLVYTLFTRLDYIRYAEGESTINCRLENGPYKGIFTDANWRDFYEETQKELNTIVDATTEDESILISGTSTWMYMCVERPVAAPTTWRMYSDHEFFEPYYDIHPDKVPPFIYVEATENEKAQDSIVLDGILYQKIYNGTGTIYERKN